MIEIRVQYDLTWHGEARDVACTRAVSPVIPGGIRLFDFQTAWKFVTQALRDGGAHIPPFYEVTEGCEEEDPPSLEIDQGVSRLVREKFERVKFVPDWRAQSGDDLIVTREVYILKEDLPKLRDCRDCGYMSR